MQGNINFGITNLCWHLHTSDLLTVKRAICLTLLKPSFELKINCNLCAVLINTVPHVNSTQSSWPPPERLERVRGELIMPALK